MPDTTSLPKPLPAGLRWYVRLSKWMLGLALSFWVLLLLASLALHFLIVPRIIDWRTEIEAAASKAWGVKVSIGQLTTVSDGLVPSVEVSDFVLRNAQDQEVLRLPKLRASLSPASLLSLKLERIELDAQSWKFGTTRMGLGRWPVWPLAPQTPRHSPIGCCANPSFKSTKVGCAGLTISISNQRWPSAMSAC